MQAVARMASPDHSIHRVRIPGDQVISMHPSAGIIATQSSQLKGGAIMTSVNGNIHQGGHHSGQQQQQQSPQFLHPAHHQPIQMQSQQQQLHHGPPPPAAHHHNNHHHHHQHPQGQPMQSLASQAIPIQGQIPANYENHHLGHLSAPPPHSAGPAGPIMIPSSGHPMNEFSHQFAQAGNNPPQYMPAFAPQQNHQQPQHPHHLQHHQQQQQQQQQQGLVHRGELRELNRGFPPHEADPFAAETIKARGKIISQLPQQYNSAGNGGDGSPFTRVPHHHHQSHHPQHPQHHAVSNENHFTAFQEQLQIHQQQQQQLQEMQSRQGRSMMHSPSAGMIASYQPQQQQHHRMRSPQNQENLHPFQQANPHQQQFHSAQPHHRPQLARDPAQYSADQDRERKLKMLISENAQLISENEYYKQHLQSQSKEVQSSIQLEQEINELNLKVQQLSAQLQIQTDETSVWIAREREMSQRCRQLYDQAQQSQQSPPAPSSAQSNQEKQELLVKIYNLEGDARNQQRQIEELNACLQFYKESLRTQQMSVTNSQQSHTRNSSLPSGQQQQQQQQQNHIYYEQQQPQQQQFEGFQSHGTVEQQQQQQQVYSSPRHREELIQTIVQQCNIPASARSASASASVSASTPTSQLSHAISQNQGVNRQNYQQQYPQSSHNSTNGGYASLASGDMKQEGTSKDMSQVASEIAEPISDWKQQYNLLTQKLNSLGSNTNQN